MTPDDTAELAEVFEAAALARPELVEAQARFKEEYFRLFTAHYLRTTAFASSLYRERGATLYRRAVSELSKGSTPAALREMLASVIEAVSTEDEDGTVISVLVMATDGKRDPDVPDADVDRLLAMATAAAEDGGYRD